MVPSGLGNQDGRGLRSKTTENEHHEQPSHPLPSSQARPQPSLGNIVSKTTGNRSDLRALLFFLFHL